MLLFTIAGLLLIGCSGQMPTSAGITEMARTIQTAAEQQAAEDQGQAVSESSIAETNAAAETNAINKPALPGIPLFTFEPGEPRWFTVDDNVMGGISNSIVGIAEPDILAFIGTMSLENNGGFASARSEWQTVDLSESDGILLRVLGDGNTYRLRIRTTTTDQNISYNARFATTPGQWQTIYLPYSEMVPTYFGYVMDVGPIDKANIGSFGFMLSDNQPGEFELYVDWVRAVSEEELVALRS
jgi:monofunctional biosynthetic peptidoglycan transglycosylase